MLSHIRLYLPALTQVKTPKSKLRDQGALRELSEVFFDVKNPRRLKTESVAAVGLLTQTGSELHQRERTMRVVLSVSRPRAHTHSLEGNVG